MKILFDENLLRKLVGALREEGHEVESVHTAPAGIGERKTLRVRKIPILIVAA